MNPGIKTKQKSLYISVELDSDLEIDTRLFKKACLVIRDTRINKEKVILISLRGSI